MTSRPVGRFDVGTVLEVTEAALAALGEAREEIDALNVYPVPDGDTGTNLFLTVESARAALVEQAETGDDVAAALAAAARGTLLGARGNSGVILSQLVKAVAKRLTGAADEPPARLLADALAQAADAAYAAVGEPVEGTILTVARAAADAAGGAAAAGDASLADTLRAAAEAARDAVRRTPRQLAVLEAAGVVDAGGRGLSVVLDAAEGVLSGRRPTADRRALGAATLPVRMPAGDLTREGPAYEVMYLLDADDERIPGLRRALAPLGDSLVVVGGDGLWNVHVHVDDVGAAVEAGIAAGRPHRIRVTHFAEQERDHAAADAATGTGRAVVVVAAGEGLADLFREAGATVVPGGPGVRPSTGQILDAVRSTDASEVVILPNDGDSVAAAQAAAGVAGEEGTRVAVIPTRAQVQGLAALAVHEPGRGFDDDVLQMTAAARHARHGAVTVATKQAITTAGPCEPGDVLGAIEGDFVLVGEDLFDVAAGVLERLLGGGGELVTLVAGESSGGLDERCATYLSSAHPTVDVVRYDGGQPRYPLLVGVE